MLPFILIALIFVSGCSSFNQSYTSTWIGDVIVDYNTEIEEGFKEDPYDHVHAMINNKNFTHARRGTAYISIEAICFNKELSTKEALEKLDSYGFRPANFEELLAFNKINWMRYKEYKLVFLTPLIALGTEFRGKYIEASWRDKKRQLELKDCTSRWKKDSYFLAVSRYPKT